MRKGNVVLSFIAQVILIFVFISIYQCFRYAGPETSQISDSFSVNNWGMSMVSRKKIIYGFIDGRGSSKQTAELLHQVYRQLGTKEVQDQLSVTKLVLCHEVLKNTITLSKLSCNGDCYTLTLDG